MQGRLQSRLSQLEKFHQERAEVEEKRRTHSTGELFVAGFPTEDRWDEFAPLTWIKSGGTIKRFKPYEIQKKLIESIRQNQ